MRNGLRLRNFVTCLMLQMVHVTPKSEPRCKTSCRTSVCMELKLQVLL